LNWKASIKSLANEARVMARVLRHPDSPWPARLIAAAAAAYVLSPVQLIPTFIPIIGQLDDVLVICAALRWIRRITPAPVFADCADLSCSPARRVTSSYSIGLESR